MGGDSTTTTVQNNEPYGPSQPLIDQGLADARTMYERGGFNITPYAGDLVADTDSFSNTAYSMAPGIAGQALDGATAAQGGLYRALDPSARSGAFDTVRQNVIDRVMPSINRSFAGSGMTGSSLHAQNLAKGLASGMAEVEDRAFQTGENRALQAAGMMGGINRQLAQPLDMLRDIGGERQRQAQAEIQALALQDQQGKSAEMAALQDYLSLTTGAGSMFGVQSSTASRGGGNGGLFGALGLGLQAAPLFFPSDRRLKTDVRRVGETDDGLPIYTYRYKGSPTFHMGVMAQDVEKVNPAAVAEISGYKAVRYDLVQ